MSRAVFALYIKVERRRGCLRRRVVLALLSSLKSHSGVGAPIVERLQIIFAPLLASLAPRSALGTLGAGRVLRTFLAVAFQANSPWVTAGQKFLHIKYALKSIVALEPYFC